MHHDTKLARGDRPFVFMSLAADPLARPVATWLEGQLVAG